MERMDRVNQMMKREVSNIIQRELGNPQLSFVTVVAVDVSKDLRKAVVYFSVLGDDKRIEEASEALVSTEGYVRRLLGKRIRLRYTPKIEFVYDPSLDYGARIERTLRDIKGISSGSSDINDNVNNFEE